MDRREFLRLSGLALGGIALYSCGWSGGRGGTTTPNGFRFYRLINRGDELPDGTTIVDLPGSAMISAVDTVVFHAKDSSGAMGCYELTVDYSDWRPTVTSIRKIVKDGDLLADGCTVAKVTAGDINRAGAYASALQLRGDDVTGLYLDRDRTGMQRVLGYRDNTPGVDGFVGQQLGDVDLHDDNNILFVAHFGNRQLGRPQVGLFHLPGGENSAAGIMIASSGDLVPNAEGIIKSFGLVDRNDGDFYVTQASLLLTKSTASPGRATVEQEPATALLAGRITQQSPAAIIAASRNVRISPAARTSAALLSSGEVIYGPRIGISQDIAHVVHTSADAMTLYYNNSAIIATGDQSPRGSIVKSLSPAVVSDDGLLYFSLFTAAGVELCVAAENRFVTILASGDVLPYDGYNRVTRFIFGAMNKQVDAKGRITFIGDYQNNAHQISSVVVGLPL